jgi:hypothetical protein
MKRTIIAILILLFAASAQAQSGQLRLDVNLVSQHFVAPPGSLGHFNESNYGVGLEYQITDRVHAAVGTYANSIGAQSWYAGAGREYFRGDNLLDTGISWNVGLEIGIASGYKDFVGEDGRHWSKQNDYMPMGGVYAKLGDKNALKIRYMFSVAGLSYQHEF